MNHPVVVIIMKVVTIIHKNIRISKMNKLINKYILKLALDKIIPNKIKWWIALVLKTKSMIKKLKIIEKIDLEIEYKKRRIRDQTMFIKNN